MSTRLTIDDFEFVGFEVPEHIEFGGEQSLALHKLPGGSRVIRSLGRDDAPLEWSGVFTGANAVNRARFLDGYRADGNIHKLTWGDFSYNVVIRRFRPRYERDQHIPYTICCEVEENLTQPVAAAAEGADLHMVIVEDMERVTVAADALKPSLVDTIAASIKAVQAVVANVQSVFDAVTEGIASVVNLETAAIATIQASVESAIATVAGCEAMINSGVDQLKGLFDGSSATGSAVKTAGEQLADLLNVWSVDTVNLTLLAQMRSSLKVMSKNLGYINGAPNAKQVTVSGGSLSDLALKHYGDATQWPRIAKANGMTDPMITGVQTITIPPAASTPSNVSGGYDIDHWIGEDVGLSNSNDLGTVIGTPKAQQRILRRLLTNPNSYKWHPTYGAGVLKHVGDSDYNLPALKSLIVAQVLLEKGVAQSPAPVVTFDTNGDEVTANIEYVDAETNSRQFISFTVQQ